MVWQQGTAAVYLDLEGREGLGPAAGNQWFRGRKEQSHPFVQPDSTGQDFARVEVVGKRIQCSWRDTACP